MFEVDLTWKDTNFLNSTNYETEDVNLTWLRTILDWEMTYTLLRDYRNIRSFFPLFHCQSIKYKCILILSPTEIRETKHCFWRLYVKMYFKSYQQMTLRSEFFKLVLRIFSLFFFSFSSKLTENAERNQPNHSTSPVTT